MRGRILAGLFLSSFLAEPAFAQPAELAPLVKVKGDALDPEVTVTTDGVVQGTEKTIWGSRPVEISFLRGSIDKATGRARAQIYHIARYRTRTWHFFTRASYSIAGNVKAVEVGRVGSDVDCSRYGCGFTEDVTIPIDISELERIAADKSSGGISYRIFAQSGTTVDGVILGDEVEAFITVFNRYRAPHPLQAAAPEAAVPPHPAVAIPTPAAPPATKPRQVARPKADQPAVRCETCR
jgi:hypothetical protein